MNDNDQKMRITFLSPHINISGGVKIILGYAHGLSKKGHEVTVICPQPTFAKIRITRIPAVLPKRFLMNLVKHKPVWIDVDADVKYVPSYDEKYIPDADIVVASAWQTAEYVHSYSLKKGQKFYLFQHYERLWKDGCDDVDTFSFRLPLRKIVISSCLRDFFKKQCDEEAILILDPVDLGEFFPTRRKYNDKKRICMLYQPYPWKGVEDGIKAYEIARKAHPEIHLIMFGPRENSRFNRFEYHHNPTNYELREIYNSCDIFLCPSWREGFGLPSAEAMACKCALVTTDNGGSRDYALHRKTALVSPPKDPERLAKNLLRLIENEEILKTVAENGYEHIKQFTWERAVDKMEKEFRKVIQKK